MLQPKMKPSFTGKQMPADLTDEQESVYNMLVENIGSYLLINRMAGTTKAYKMYTHNKSPMCYCKQKDIDKMLKLNVLRYDEERRIVLHYPLSK